MVVLIVGSVVAYRGNKNDNGVEIIENVKGIETAEVVVDVGGAVEKPGVYKLPGDARVNDALTAAGGLSVAADRVWMARYLNLAQAVSDGVKIYIPATGESVIGSGSQSSGQININTASASELDSLWGIGTKRAADIIASRPYSSIDELVAKAGIPQNVLDKIRDQIIAY